MLNQRKIYQLKLEKKQEKPTLKGRFTALLPKDLGKVLLGFSLSALVASFFVQIYISNTYAVKGSEMVMLQHKQSSLEKEISGLRLAVSEASSLVHIEDKAQALGFVEMDSSVKIIGTVSTVASNL